VTAACSPAAVSCAGGWFFRLGGVPDVFQNYGLLLLLSTVGLGILAGFRTWDGVPPKTVHLIADDFQSFWSQSRQKDGRITTQFCFRMKVTNLTDGPIVLSRSHKISRSIPESSFISGESPSCGISVEHNGL